MHHHHFAKYMLIDFIYKKSGENWSEIESSFGE